MCIRDRPANATDRAVVWSVLPTGFATVANGVVTGIKAGNCTVTATAGGKLSLIHI